MASAEVYLSDWQWVHRMELAFKAFDSDEDRLISLEDFQGWVDNVEKDLGDEGNSEKISALGRVMKEYGIALGFKENDDEKITAYDFVKLMAEFTAKEKETFQNKGIQETMIAKVNHAWFDVLSSENFVLLEGYRRLTKATNFDTKVLVVEECTADKRIYKSLSAADFFFKTVLSDPKDGGPKKISREEMIQNQFQFFHTVNHPKGLYGPNFESQAEAPQPVPKPVQNEAVSESQAEAPQPVPEPVQNEAVSESQPVTVATISTGTPTVEDYLNDPLWIHRIEQKFRALDHDEDLLVSLEDLQVWVAKIEEEVVSPPPGGFWAQTMAWFKKKFGRQNTTTATLRTAIHEYGTAIGLEKGEKLTSYQFVELFAVFAEKEMKAYQEQGLSQTKIAGLNRALFNMVDGQAVHVTRENYRKITKAMNFDSKKLIPREQEHHYDVESVSVADHFFDHHEAGIERLEMKTVTEKQVMFFYTIGNSSTRGLYGPAFDL